MRSHCAEQRHLRARASADDELERGVDLPHGACRLHRQTSVLPRGSVADLPRPVHLVAEAPHPDVIGLDGAVRDSAIRQLGAAADVRVLEHVERLFDPASAEVDGVHELAADLRQPPRELVQADLIGLGRVPCEIQASGTLIDGADAVLPSVARHEVAAGVSDGRDAEFADELRDVLSEPVLIGFGVSGLVDAVVDAPSEVLDERAEQTTIDGPDHEMRVDGEMCGDHDSSMGEGLVGSVRQGRTGYLRLPMASPPRQ